MVQQINKKEFHHSQKVDIIPEDAMKDSVELTRYLSKKSIKITYWFKLVSTSKIIKSIPWSSAMNKLISHIQLTENEKKLVKKAEKIIPDLATFQDGGMNTKGICHMYFLN